MRNTMSRRSLMRGARFQPPDPQLIERYLLFFNSKELFWSQDRFAPIDSLHLFGNHLPIQLEIGCGSADFLCALALEHPHINFVGIDISLKPLFKAIRTAATHALPNIKFIRETSSGCIHCCQPMHSRLPTCTSPTQICGS